MLHYYAVYDGHGGAEASEHCASKMHENVREAWNNLPGHPTCSGEGFLCDDNDERPPSSEDIVEMFRTAFKWTDDEFRLKNENSAIIGSTAVVALIGDHHIFIGYCGASIPLAAIGPSLADLQEILVLFYAVEKKLTL